MNLRLGLGSGLASLGYTVMVGMVFSVTVRFPQLIQWRVMGGNISILACSDTNLNHFNQSLSPTYISFVIVEELRVIKILRKKKDFK